jgi:hypothetical protein
MIDVTFQPTQLVIDQISSLSIKVTNSGNRPCTHVNFRLRLPSQIVLLEGTDKIENAKIDPGLNIILTMRVRPKQVGSWIIGSSSFSYRDSQGQPHHPTPLQHEITVIPMVSIPKSQALHSSDRSNPLIISDRSMVGDSSALNHSTLSPEDMTYLPKTIRPLSNNGYEKEVFVSYAWGGESESTVHELEQAFANHGIRIVRDKKDLEYKGSIEGFEQRIGQGKCIVLVISDKYLRSEHCMYELVRVNENHNLRERIFPIVLADARIYKALDRLAYIKYWEERIEELNYAIKEMGRLTNLAGITANLDKYARIRSNIDHLTDLLNDMNALTPELHAVNGYSNLIREVERSLV